MFETPRDLRPVPVLDADDEPTLEELAAEARARRDLLMRVDTWMRVADVSMTHDCDWGA